VLPLGVARTVTHLMLGVVRSGTGKAAAIPGVQVAGKTGTAELKTTAGTCTPDQTASQTCTTPEKDPKNTDAWFVAFAPAGRARVTVGVLLAHNGAGGDTAAPVARIMLKAALEHTAYAAAPKKPRPKKPRR
jgi:cell division protein FtsI/penicillin-binding protein 2